MPDPTARTLAASLLGSLAAFSASTAHATDYDITAFGAVANDGVSDFAAIQAAIGAASAGDRVVLPAGTFHITSFITPKAGIAIVGAGRDNTVIQHTGAASTDGMIRLDTAGQNNVEIAGLTLDGQNSTLVEQGMVIDSTSGHHIHNIRVTNLVGNSFGPAGIYASFNADNNLIENNEFLNIGVADHFGSGLRFDHGSQGNQVIGNTIDNTGRGGIFFSNGSTDSVIRGNTVTRSGQAAEGLGIEVWGNSHRSVIEDNNIDHWLSIDRSNNVAVRNNTVAATDGSLKFIGIEVAGGSDIVIQGNTVGPGNQIGLSMSSDTDKQRIYVANNAFTGSETWGAQLQDGDNGTGEVRQIYFYNNTFELAEADAPNAYSPAGVGLRFNAVDGGGGIRQIVFDTNQVINNDHAGFQMYTDAGGTLDQISFIGNTISGNGDAAFIDFPAFNNLEWAASNTVTGNDADNTLAPAASSPGFADNAKPSLLQIVAPTQVNVGESVALGFFYADDGGPTPAQVLWDLGEGLPETTLAPTHAFTEEGTYNIALIAWDAQGRAAHDTFTIEVVPEPGSLAVLGIGSLLLARRRR